MVCTDALWFWIVHRPPATYTLPLAVTHDADDRGALNNAGSPRGVPSTRATSLWRDHVPVTVHSSGVLAPVGAASTSSRCSVCRLDDCVPPACVPPNTSKSPPTLRQLHQQGNWVSPTPANHPDHANPTPTHTTRTQLHSGCTWPAEAAPTRLTV